MLEKQLMDIKKLDPPFKQAPKPRPKERITWLEPELVAEIKFAQWTKDGLLRQASFKGLRTDKDPKDIRKEVPDVYKRQPYLTPNLHPGPGQIP